MLCCRLFRWDDSHAFYYGVLMSYDNDYDWQLSEQNDFHEMAMDEMKQEFEKKLKTCVKYFKEIQMKTFSSDPKEALSYIQFAAGDILKQLEEYDT